MQFVYFCNICNINFDIDKRMGHAPRKAKCPKCGHMARRIFTLSGIVFKGPGFYASDHRKEQLKKQHTEFSDPREE